MNFGNRDNERLWIALIFRFAFGFLFLFAAINIFTYYDTKAPAQENRDLSFANIGKSLSDSVTELSAPYENTWLNFKWKWWPAEYDEATKSYIAKDIGMPFIHGFVFVMPFIFLGLAICLLTGFGARVGLRFGALYMVVLGLGKYATGDTVTTAQDFLYAALLCLGLFLTAREPEEEAALDAL